MIGALVAGVTGSGGASLSSYESIATATASGSVSTLSFSSIPSGFKHLQIRGMGNDLTGNTPRLRINSDSGTNYAFHRLYGDGATAAASGSATQSFINLGVQIGTTSNQMWVVVFDILDYGSTSKYKTVRSFSGMDNNGSGQVAIYSGLWQSTSAITALEIYDSGGTNFTSNTTFALYGIKEA